MSDQYNPFDQFSDEDLASLGVSREELTPENALAVAARVQGGAEAQWAENEQGIEELLVHAHRAISAFPDSRVRAFAQLYGESMRDLHTAEVKDIDPDHVVHLFLFAVFKLAESRNREAALSDGNRRRGREDDN